MTISNLMAYFREFLFGIIDNVFSTQNLSPHGFCLFWQPDLMAITIIGNISIWIAYIWIAVQLLIVFYKTKKVRGRIILESRIWLLFMFSLFIFLCAQTHLMDLIVLYYPYYYAQALLNLLTGLVSLTTASVLQFAAHIEPAEPDYHPS